MSDETLRYGNSEDGHRSSRPRGLTPCVDPDHTGHGDPNQRFRIYRLCACEECSGSGVQVRFERVQYAGGRTAVRCKACRGEGSSLSLIATCGTPGAVGVAIVTLAREDELDGCPIGILDDQGEPGQKWLVRPWLASPRNVRDAARLLQKQRHAK
jgi:hypothetical protein